jgi:hypothetical protein
VIVLANVKLCGGAEITVAKKSDIFLPFFYHGILKCPDELKQLYVMMYEGYIFSMGRYLEKLQTVWLRGGAPCIDEGKHLAVFFLFPSKKFLPISYKIQLWKLLPKNRRNKVPSCTF